MNGLLFIGLLIIAVLVIDSTWRVWCANRQRKEKSPPIEVRHEETGKDGFRKTFQ